MICIGNFLWKLIIVLRHLLIITYNHTSYQLIPNKQQWSNGPLACCFLTETWLQQEDNVSMNESTPSSYFLDPRFVFALLNLWLSFSHLTGGNWNRLSFPVAQNWIKAIFCYGIDLDLPWICCIQRSSANSLTQKVYFEHWSSWEILTGFLTSIPS